MWKSKFYGAFVLNHRVYLHAIDATPARRLAVPDSVKTKVKAKTKVKSGLEKAGISVLEEVPSRARKLIVICSSTPIMARLLPKR